MARVQPDYRTFYEETDRLLALLRSMTALGAMHRKLIAEIVHLRLAILLENHMKIIFSKLCCGTPYIDGSVPTCSPDKRLLQPRCMRCARLIDKRQSV
jgi:hypothetical protein